MLTIAWDVDDVLNNLMYEWFTEEWMAKRPRCALKYADLKINPPHEILSTSLDEYLGSLDLFRSAKYYQQMRPVQEILEWFRGCGKNYRHIALTAVPAKAASFSASWVFNNFGQWIRTFHFIPSKRKGEANPQYDNDKIDYLQWLNRADILVEDKEENIRSAAKINIKGVLIPRPWNSARCTIGESLRLLENLSDRALP